MEENNEEKVVKIADGLMDLRMETDKLIESDKEIKEGCKNLINECNKILNS